MSPWIQYTLLRLGLFGAVLAILLALDIDWWWAAIVATVIAMTVSYIFFSRLRDAVALDLHERRTRRTVDPDAAAEDDVEDDAAAERP